MSEPDLFLGLMSGTSADGIDAALVHFDEHGGRLRADVRHALTHPWQPDLRERLIAVGQGGPLTSLDELGQLDTGVGRAFGEAALALIAAAGIDKHTVRAIGSHGQTIRHRPALAAPFSMQIGCAAHIAEISGIDTVADFRRRDIAAGGQGAPLLPAIHKALLQDAAEDRAVLNLGGIANITLLPRGDGDAAASDAIRGFDTGPANALLDLWCQLHTGQPYDDGGRFAAQGVADAALLQRLLADPWFAAPPPKSTGREHFHLAWLSPHLSGDETAADVQTTLLALAARTVADALRTNQPATQRLLVCGGGVHNPVLMAALAAELPGSIVESTGAHGVSPDHLEAIGFAWLARQTLRRQPGNLPGVTGAKGSRVLGAVYLA